MITEMIEIKEKLKKFILETTSVDENNINDQTLIFTEGYFDSMGFVLLITFLEETFGIKTLDSDLVEENFESIDAMSDFVLKKLN